MARRIAHAAIRRLGLSHTARPYRGPGLWCGGARRHTRTLARVMTSGLPATAGVVGLGRFGRLWASMLQGDFALRVYDSDPAQCAEAERIGLIPASLRETLASDAVFYCVPISAFESTLREHLPLYAELGGPRTLIDVLSVKLHPRDGFERPLPGN